MLPGLKEKMRTAIKTRTIVQLIAAPGESSRQIEPWLLWESTADGLMLVGRQTHGHVSAGLTLPAWRQFKLSQATQVELTSQRFEPEPSSSYAQTRKKLKRKPVAEIQLDSKYTLLGDTEHGPPPAVFSSTTQFLKNTPS